MVSLLKAMTLVAMLLAATTVLAQSEYDAIAAAAEG